ncbi:uncharacterized protein LOC126845423 [Adelges cooleyi]|uniref:uncharacterized protein LOC126837020 n=1 Tax=Adelges cooleyi TaxID=133065 RepID=UPI00218097F3|nr:uncharacterized protein LOC126837020 [Adelges cooleyi]XP_050431094.1 uncharacterized protein LOC126839719 [Adelges cooleyi]XP_050435186.1 uncharacterized protein LOC126842300 [Adelges cooleyi]XP_050440022.1 uncharacterized protein LOC126845410 [Adelges cooleyi]XP_050440036.1 uncharacterized protein LOC126845423 [Adelges cooleyi]
MPRVQKCITGKGLVNTLINKLPFEAHLPGYKYCGPGTKLEKRLARGDKPINLLDEACRDHDIAYLKNKDVTNRNLADKKLEFQAWDRVKAKDSSFGEKAAAYTVTNIMKAKRKIGMGCCKAKKGGKLVGAVRKRISRRKSKKVRKIKVPNQRGSAIPLIPIFAGLSALGSLASGAANIYKAVKDSKTGQTKKIGKGLYLNVRNGKGLYLDKSGLGVKKRRNIKKKKTNYYAT